MCAGYGLELSGPNSSGGRRPRRFGQAPLGQAPLGQAPLGQAPLGQAPLGQTPLGPIRLGPIPPGDGPEGRALLEAWVRDRDGHARITGRNARNLNPLITGRGGARELSLGWWWLHVGGAPAKFTAFNSRADRLLQSWREPFQHRALLPATWYVEKGVRFALPGAEEFGMAAVTAPVAGDPDPDLASYSLVTRDALGEAADTHDRMPLVLPRELHDEWLDPERAGDADLVRRALLVSEEISRELRAAEQPRLF